MENQTKAAEQQKPPSSQPQSQPPQQPPQQQPAAPVNAPLQAGSNISAAPSQFSREEQTAEATGKPQENGDTKGGQESQGGDSGDSSQRLDQANKRIEELEERVRVAEAQVASHWELLRRLYDVILVFDMSGIIIFASPACEEVLGYSQKELFNRPLAAILAESFHQEFEAKVRSMIKIQTQRALKGKELFMNARFIRKNGQEVTLEGLGQAWQLENVVELVFSFREHPPEPEEGDARKVAKAFHPPVSQAQPQPQPMQTPHMGLPPQQGHYTPSSGGEGMRPPVSDGYPSEYGRGHDQMRMEYMNNMHPMYYSDHARPMAPQPPQQQQQQPPQQQMPHPMYNPNQPQASGMPMHPRAPYQYMPQQFWGQDQMYGMMGGGRPMQQPPRGHYGGPDSSPHGPGSSGM